MNFKDILNKYREISFSERDKGDRFERLMKNYFLTDPQYTSTVEKVWLWSEFPAKDDFGGKDIGIDLVAYTFDGQFWAIQCKFYDEKTAIDKASVDSFLSTSGRSFINPFIEEETFFSNRFWVSTTDKWSSNAEEVLRKQTPQVQRINLHNLNEAPVRWEELDKGTFGEIARASKKTLRPHQINALENTNNHFKNADRGKLIMACGTGKTFTSLRIAENETNGNGLVLFLVPSIALLGQTLREWSADASEPINPICICSDPKITRSSAKNEDSQLESVMDLAYPATTDIGKIVSQLYSLKTSEKKGLKVVFSTYQSIDVISKAQSKIFEGNLFGKDENFGIFDLIICDEAHRTTGVVLSSKEESAFTKVHDNDFIKANKRLYMTATPRLYSDDVKGKVAQKDQAYLCSMDDPLYYGEEIYRIGFGEAVNLELLTDYKVLILTLNDKDIPPAIQKMISDENEEIDSDDASKLIGCINAMSKQILGDSGIIKDSDPEPMRRAVAFCQNIKISKSITNIFNDTSGTYLDSLPQEKREEMVTVYSNHIDGSMSAPQRDSLLGWLKEEQEQQNECRVLTNVRCLSEGVDVPSLDAVVFLSPRGSQVDVVQSVGRVMRRSEGKKYGYIIIPIVVPSDVSAEDALNDNERYKTVWSVLNALRAHDDRFEATVNQLDLNKKKPSQILVGRPQYEFGSGKAELVDLSDNNSGTQMALQFEQLQKHIFAKMAMKVGTKDYWEVWAKDIAIIAEKQVERINRLINDGGEHEKAFGEFLEGLRANINPSISKQEAIEMLSQHIITKPVFEALFDGYSFVKNNPISLSMQRMLDLLEEQAIEKDTESLEKFYASVKTRAQGIDNAEGKQKIIIELYDKFFKSAFPKMVEKLGIVYTPVEVVDFILHSVNDVLKAEFGRSITEENVNIIDPFTGTGTFITRLLQSGLIKKEDLQRKYTKEIFANEIVLLAYYIAAVNIENAYHDLMDNESYDEFKGICLTDTFQLMEDDEIRLKGTHNFPENTERVNIQKNTPIQIIIGNPPYSIGQKSANDNAQNQKYPKLDERILNTYSTLSNAGLNKSLYNSSIKAFRWSSDKIESGIIAFITNSGWINSNAYDGFRKSLESEFHSIYVYNLKGEIRGKSKSVVKKEGENIFDIITGVAITVLVKKEKSLKKAEIYYKEIPDGYKKKEKLNYLKSDNSILKSSASLIKIRPNEEGDWLNHRTENFSSYIPLEPSKKFSEKALSVFTTYSLGIGTNRDFWMYNFSALKLKHNIEKTIDFYNNQVLKYLNENKDELKIEDFVQNDLRHISWTRGLRNKCKNGVHIQYKENVNREVTYRPFTKTNIYFDKNLIESPGQNDIFFPFQNTDNLIISVPGTGSVKDFYAFITKNMRDLDTYGGCQCFPLYYYEEDIKQNLSLFNNNEKNGITKKDGISDYIFKECKKKYGSKMTKEDIFFYVYGLLNSEDYKKSFANDLKKMLPRLPLVDTSEEFWAFSKAGRSLADLHLNYETVPSYEGVIVKGEDSNFFKVEKMRFPKKDEKHTINYNSKISIENIPDKAYEYIVNGKSAIEWIIDRYQIRTDTGKSEIVNDPNDWADEVGNPRYILDLLLSIINVSVQTVDIVKSLPKLKF